MAAHITQHVGRVTEIALNPEELGRVRMAMTAVDASITLSVLAERPETADLLRRNIDMLAQEFRALGYDDISFSFGDNGPSAEEKSSQNEQMSDDVTSESGPAIKSQAQPISGLDLRL